MLNADRAVKDAAGDGESSLIARAATGDRAAACVLYDLHAGRVFRLAYRMCGDEDLAADLTQDVFVRVFRQLAQFRGDAAFTTWLHRVAVNTCLNTLRKVKRFRAREVELDLASDRAGHAADRDPLLLAAVGNAIDELPEALRVALVMYAIEGFTHGEIASALGIAEGTSKSRVFDARVRLRQTLAIHGKEYHDE